MDERRAEKEIKRLYHGLGWPTIFTYIRFFTAPYQAIEKYVPKKGIIVDLGCGYGLFSNYLGLTSSQRRVVGVELDENKIKYADKKIKNVNFFKKDITKMKLPQVEAFLLIHVFHHLNSFKEQEALLAECVKKLKRGGLLLIVEIDKKPWWKFLITQLADHILYPGDKIYYRFEKEMVELLKPFSFKLKIRRIHQGKPFSHMLYLGYVES